MKQGRSNHRRQAKVSDAGPTPSEHLAAGSILAGRVDKRAVYSAPSDAVWSKYIGSRLKQFGSR